MGSRKNRRRNRKRGQKPHPPLDPTAVPGDAAASPTRSDVSSIAREKGGLASTGSGEEGYDRAGAESEGKGGQKGAGSDEEGGVAGTGSSDEGSIREGSESRTGVLFKRRIRKLRYQKAKLEKTKQSTEVVDIRINELEFMRSKIIAAIEGDTAARLQKEWQRKEDAELLIRLHEEKNMTLHQIELRNIERAVARMSPEKTSSIELAECLKSLSFGVEKCRTYVFDQTAIASTSSWAKTLPTNTEARKREKDDNKLCEDFQEFLERYEDPADGTTFYIGEAYSMAARLSAIFRVEYLHLEKHDRALARSICCEHRRLIQNLSMVAQHFVSSIIVPLKTVFGDVNWQKIEQGVRHLQLQFIRMPERHEMLKSVLKSACHSKHTMAVYDQGTVFLPTLISCRLLIGVMDEIFQKHLSGFSWEGCLQINDIEVYDHRRIVITKPAKKVDLGCTFIPKETIEAFQKDLLFISTSILPDFLHYSKSPHWSTFDSALRNPKIRDDLNKHAFRHPTKDNADYTWMDLIGESGRSVMMEVLAYPITKGLEAEIRHEDYNNSYRSFIDFLRQLFEHGVDYTYSRNPAPKRIGPDGKPVKRPRIQNVQLREEMVVLAGVHLDIIMHDVVEYLVLEIGMTGKLASEWTAYKNYNY